MYVEEGSFAQAAQPLQSATWPASLDNACDDADAVDADAQRYCPTAALNRFTLLMAGQGRCVSPALMLGDREYAMWQLARARSGGDPALRALAARLFAYFAPAA